MDGRLERVDGGQWRLRFTRHLAHPVEKVWQHVTEPEHLRHWFPAAIIGEFVVGGSLRFEFEPGVDAGHTGTVLAVESMKVLEFSWTDGELVDILRIELEPAGDDGCVLTFLNTLSEQGYAARTAAGWQVCLDALAAGLDDRPGPADDAWREVYAGYVAEFGPEAATVGPPDQAAQGDAQGE